MRSDAFSVFAQKGLILFLLWIAGESGGVLPKGEAAIGEAWVKNFSCELKLISKDETSPPVLEVLLKYHGKEPLTLLWDGSFARVLWSGAFVLKRLDPDGETSSEALTVITGNTYEAKNLLVIQNGAKLRSELDFSKLPGSYLLKPLLKKSSGGRLQLYLKFQEKLFPVGKSLSLDF